MLINLFRHRDYIWRTAWNDVRTRYAGAGLGFVWNLLQPLSLILVFTVVFTSLMPHSAIRTSAGADVHYTVYLCAAMLPWIAFSDCLNRGTASFVTNAIYLRKLPIPEQVFVAQAALSSMFSLAISFVILLAVALVLGHHPTWHWLLLPVPLALLIAMGFGLGLLLGTINAFIRDVGQIVPIVLQVAFWLFPIAYFEDLLDKPYRSLLQLNPVYPFLTSIRDLFVWGRMPPIESWPLMLGWCAVTSIVGYVVLRRLRPELRDVV
jgi:ABC-type polysaccharide/polyol phosphate export permease